MAIEQFGDKHISVERQDKHKQWHGISLTPVLKRHATFVPGQVQVRCEQTAISERMLKVYAYDFGTQEVEVFHFAWATFMVIASFSRDLITNDRTNFNIDTNHNFKKIDNDTALIMTCLSAGESVHTGYVNPIRPGATFLTLWSWNFKQSRDLLPSKPSKAWVPNFQWRRML